MEKQARRRQDLRPHIQRIESKKPIVTAAELQRHGIVPGKTMGILIKEAERIAIAHDLHEPIAVIEILKKSTHWPLEL